MIKAPDQWFQDRIIQDGGVFDVNSYNAAMRCITGWRTALDIGAHCGSWTCAMAGRFKHVHAFEPQPVNFSYLKENAQNLGNVTLHNSAVGAVAGMTHMQSGDHNSGQWHIAKDGDITAEVISIDDLGLDDADFIKIDVEGFELHALTGACKTIARCSPVICLEMNGLSDRYGTPESLIKLLMDEMGYSLKAVANKDYIYGK